MTISHQTDSQPLDYIQKHERTGNRILLALVIVNILFYGLSLVVSFLNGSFSGVIHSIIMAVLCLFIYVGGMSAKWIYVILTALNLVAILMTLFADGRPVYVNTLLFVMIAIFINLLIPVTTSLILIFSTSVNEFMYKQRD